MKYDDDNGQKITKQNVNLFQKRQIISSNLKISFNNKFINVSCGPANQTHLGEMNTELFKEIDQFRLYVRLTNFKTQQDIFDHTINLCRLERERKSNILTKLYFDSIETFLNLDLMKCPMKRGVYVSRNAQKLPNIVVEIPSFIPSDREAKFEVTVSGKVNRKREILFKSTEILKVVEV